ncbi:MAG: DUF4910 domain-containing protein [Candidatus Megaira endosymbiont of Carteria cerasiformis]|nr:DUF4910 domain-containing protein [Candidatus Megaera polyxenophila]MCC8461034.1 DUF4910 domain-containing protein [Candidatus Megaera polyxenophila]
MQSNSIYSLAEKLWSIHRSITGSGVRETLLHIKSILPGLQIKNIPSGTKVFDWTVPKEWKVRNAWIITPSGKKICDIRINNLHIVGYSVPVHKTISLAELNNHLHSLPDRPTAIPYVISFYQENWGFALSENDRKNLEEGQYEVYIDSELFDGNLTYGELIIEGKESTKEVFISTYICHPSLANDNLSGPVVTAYLVKWLTELKSRKYTYRIVFIPETIGSITYLSLNLEQLKANVFAGFNLTCVGDNRCYSYLPSRRGNTLSDNVAKHILSNIAPNYKIYKWTDRGSDERQYCAPFIDLPIVSMMRSKYGEYPEYHTSLDNLADVVSPEGLEGGFNIHKLALEAIERNCFPKVTVLCEPQLGKRGLYPSFRTNTTREEVRLITDLITWADGTKSLIEIADICGKSVWDLYHIVDKLTQNNLIDCS